MPSLIPEILFEIGKKLVEDGKSDAVIKYAFSGKEQLKTMKNVFASVTFLEFNENHYSVGWNDKSCCKFELNNDKPNSKFLMDSIGNSVINLQINRPFTILFRVMYRPIFQKIKAAKQLITFLLSVDCAKSILDEFLIPFSSTLKNLSITDACNTVKLVRNFELESFTILYDSSGDFIVNGDNFYKWGWTFDRSNWF